MPGGATTARRPRAAETRRARHGGPAVSAGLLLAAAVAALAWANSPWSSSYETFCHTELSLRLGDAAALSLDLRHWVNDGLMVLFFFVVGLELKGEWLHGRLTGRRRATVPLAAAALGLVVPALVYLSINPSGEAARAWGVVISTDTAFVLAVLALTGPTCPGGLRQFLLTLAVADDVGALTIIAVVYSDELSLLPLGMVAAGLAVMVLLRRLQVGRGPADLAVAVGIWLAALASGIHPSLAGVAIAMAIAAYPPQRHLMDAVTLASRAYQQSPNAEYARRARISIEQSLSPVERLQGRYQPWTSYLVLPVFALANAGVVLDGTALSAAARSPVTLGIIAGLVAGKLFGVSAGVMAAVRLGPGTLDSDLPARHVAGGAALSGIGFTISLFIVDLSLDDPELADQARIGVLAASVLAAVLGWTLFRLGDRRDSQPDCGSAPFLIPAVDTDHDHILGEREAPLTLVEYADFECAFCGSATGTVQEVMDHLGAQLRYVFRHLPLRDAHPHAELAARAAEAAAAQGRFWDMHDLLFQSRGALEQADLLRNASRLGLDVERFKTDLHAAATARRVHADAEGARASGVTGTPTFFVNGLRHTGPYDAARLIAALHPTRGGPKMPGRPAGAGPTSSPGRGRRPGTA